MTRFILLKCCFLFLLLPLARSAEVIKTDGSDLGITIMGSIVQKAVADNVALIKENGGVVRAVKKDFIISDKYKVLSVHKEHIEVLSKDNKFYLIYSDKFTDSLTQKKDGNSTSSALSDQYREDGFERIKSKISMTSAYRDKIIKEDLAKILMQATAEPYMENGQIVGFKMSQIDEGSIYAKSGVVNGDIITGINGQELNSVAGTINLLHSLKTADSIDVDVRRGSEIIKITAEVK